MIAGIGLTVGAFFVCVLGLAFTADCQGPGCDQSDTMMGVFLLGFLCMIAATPLSGFLVVTSGFLAGGRLGLLLRIGIVLMVAVSLICVWGAAYGALLALLDLDREWSEELQIFGWILPMPVAMFAGFRTLEIVEQQPARDTARRCFRLGIFLLPLSLLTLTWWAVLLVLLSLLGCAWARKAEWRPASARLRRGVWIAASLWPVVLAIPFALGFSGLI